MKFFPTTASEELLSKYKSDDMTHNDGSERRCEEGHNAER